MQKRNNLKLNDISREFSKVALKKEPRNMAIFLYHLIKQYPNQYCSTVEDMQKGSMCLKNTMIHDFKWSDIQFLDCLKELNQLTKYFEKRS